MANESTTDLKKGGMIKLRSVPDRDSIEINRGNERLKITFNNNYIELSWNCIESDIRHAIIIPPEDEETVVQALTDFLEREEMARWAARITS